MLMQFYPTTAEYNMSIYRSLFSAAHKLKVLSESSQEEINEAGIAYIYKILLELIETTPKTPQERALFLYDLKGITGIIVLIAGNTSKPSHLWRNFQNIALDLLNALSIAKNI